MIDYDDADDVAALSWFTDHPGLSLLLLAVALALLAIASHNDDECAAKHCDTGRPMLANHACLCVTEPK